LEEVRAWGERRLSPTRVAEMKAETDEKNL